MANAGLASIIRLHKWHLDEKRQVLVELQKLSSDLALQHEQLQQEMEDEAKKAGELETGTSLSGFCQAQLQKKRKLQETMRQIHQEIERTVEQVNDAFIELKKYETTHEQRERLSEIKKKKKESDRFDEIGQQSFYRQ
ncbi:MAG: hypothetical protein ACOYK8_02425 [Alphaproteobacteria bacterium]